MPTASTAALTWIRWSLVVAILGMIWLSPVLPAQDLPQHLAYARLFLDWHEPGLPFQDHYVLPTHHEPYYTIYGLLVALGRLTSLDVALRLVFSAYAVGVFLGFAALVRACHGDRARPGATAFLACFLVWSLVACMGFVGFTLCIPVLLCGCAALVRATGARPQRRDAVVAAACGVALSSIHLVAAGCFALIALLHAALNPGERRWRAAAGVVGAIAATAAVWARLGALGVGGPPRHLGLDEAMARAQGLDFVTDVLRITWSDLPASISYATWTVLGPFRWDGLLLVAAAIAATAAVAWRARRSAPSRVADGDESGAGAWRRTALAFAIASWLAPFGLHVPSEITFLNVRMLTVAFAIGLALVPPRWFAAAAPRAALVALCTLVVVHLGCRMSGYAREVRAPLALLAQAEPRGVLLSLVFHDRSDHFAKQFRLTHFLPMYYTVDHGGIASQFWGRYTEHLPIAHRADRAPIGPPDWNPERFTAAHLDGVDHVLIQRATVADARSVREASARAEQLLSRSTTLVRCDQAWCLYQVPPHPMWRVPHERHASTRVQEERP